ncbi:MAG: RloB domain-containing protein [Planctomycetota bacterium]
MVAVKKQIRRTKKTILFVGEGPTEKAFLQHIKQLYVDRDSDIAVTVEGGSGGSPENVINKAIRLSGCRAYDECYVLLDSDIPLKSKIKKHIKILLATPCLEGLFLMIMKHPNFSQNKVKSDYCKHEFETNYISADKKTDKKSYSDKFTRQILEERRKILEELDAILKAFEA